MAKDRYKEERDKQEAKKRAEIRELQEEAIKMTQPPIFTEEEMKELESLHKQRKVVASDYAQIPMRKQDDDIYDDGSNDSVVSEGIVEFSSLDIAGSG